MIANVLQYNLTVTHCKTVSCKECIQLQLLTTSPWIYYH